jgi:hypothetical protein
MYTILMTYHQESFLDGQLLLHIAHLCLINCSSGIMHKLLNSVLRLECIERGAILLEINSCSL